MKYFKKVVLTFISVALVLVPSTLFAATVEVKNEEELKNAIKDGGEIVLQDNITLTDIIEIKDGNVIINMNSKNITIEKVLLRFLKAKLNLLEKEQSKMYVKVTHVQFGHMVRLI